MRALIAALLIAILVPETAQAGTSADKVNCEKDIKEAAKLIYNRWSFKLFKPGAVVIEEEYALHYVLAKRAETPEECADVLARFMASLKDGHSAVSFYPGLSHSTPAVVIRTIRERLARTPGEKPKAHAYVVSRDTTDERLKPLLPGSEILEVDGIPTGELHAYWGERVSGNTPQWIDYQCDRRLLQGLAESEIDLTIREPGGSVKTVKIRRPPVKSEDERERERRAYEDTVQIATSKRLEGGWGYLRYRTFAFRTLRQTVKPFDEALDSIIDVPGLIIDLRGNGGGSSEAMNDVAGRFIMERTSMGFFNIRTPGQETIIEVWDDVTGSITSKPRLSAQPRGDTYTGAVVIVVDRTCFSACEMFTAGLQAAGRALVVGPEATGGGSGGVSVSELPSGARIQFSTAVAWRPDGQIIEGQGVAPDIRIPIRRADLASGRDRVLERAIKALQQGEAEPLKIAGAQ
jgi:C-terminal processing protease CtpA/Prc